MINNPVVVENCSFLLNKGPGYEFRGGTITIKNTYTDRMVTNGTVILQNVHNEYIVNKICQFSSQNCEAKYPIKLEENSDIYDIYYKKIFSKTCVCFD